MVNTNCWYCGKLIKLCNHKLIIINKKEYHEWSTICLCGVPNEFIDFIEKFHLNLNYKIRSIDNDITIIDGFI